MVGQPVDLLLPCSAESPVTAPWELAVPASEEAVDAFEEEAIVAFDTNWAACSPSMIMVALCHL